MMRIEKELRQWILNEVRAELEHNSTIERRDLIRAILARFVRSGDAERYIRRDGHVAWRATAKFCEWLEEGEWECDEFDNA